MTTCSISRIVAAGFVAIATAALPVPAASAAIAPASVQLDVTPNPVAPGGSLTLTAHVDDPNVSPEGFKVVFCYTDPAYQTCDVEQNNELAETFVDAAGDAQKGSIAPTTPGTYDVFATYQGMDPSTGIGYLVDSNHIALVVGNPAPVLPTLSIAGVAVREGNTTIGNVVLFPVTLSSASTTAVTATAVAASGTAIRNTDFVSVRFPIRIAAGQTRAYVPVIIIGDRVREPDETFTVTLTNIVGAAAGQVVATGTILNDD